MKKQSGFLVIAAVVLIVIFGILTAGIVHLFLASISTSNHILASHRADYLARSGLEDGLLAIKNGQACGSLNITKTLNNGQYYASPAFGTNPSGGFASLVSISANSMVVDNSTVFASSGRAFVAGEAIEYQSNDTSTNTLNGLTRAVDGTPLSNPLVGDRVSQYQCTVMGWSQAPSLLASSYLTQAVQLSAVFAVGQSSMTWNAPVEGQWNAGSNPSRLNSVSMLNYADGWAVGDKSGGNLVIARYDPATNGWIQQATSFSINEDLHSVSTVSNLEAWAVGDEDSNRFTLLRWTPSAWCLVGTTPSCGGKQITSSITNNNEKRLLSIDTVDIDNDGYADFGFAGGGREGGNPSQNIGRVLIYNGTTWSDSSIASSQVGVIFGLEIIKNGNNIPIQAWAAARSTQNKQGKILVWTGTSWSVVLTTPEQMLNIAMVDNNGDGIADYGWAVGRKGLVYYYNGSSFSAMTLGNQDLNDVTIISANDAWIVAQNGNRWHWDGSSWNIVNTGIANAQQLNGIDSVHASVSPTSQWREITAP